MKNETRQRTETVSIVVCSKGRHNSLIRTLQTLGSYSRDEKLLEIIVVEETDNPQPLTGEKIRYFPIPQRGYGFAYARNIGLRASHGRLIVFVDDDVIPADNWLSKLIEPLEDSSVGAVGGAILPDRSELNEIGKAVSLLGFPAGGLPRYLEFSGKITETNLISTGNCAFRADLARRTGGFDECLRSGGEDQDFFHKISQFSRAIFAADAIVYHRQRDSLKQVFTWFVRRGKAEFFRECKRHHPLKAIFLPLRRNFLLKVAVLFFSAFVISRCSVFFAAAFLAVACTSWGFVLSSRAYVRLKRRSSEALPSEIRKIMECISNKRVWYKVPTVKATMDLGQEVGKLLGFLHYLSNRILSKPMVLAFHHLGNTTVTATGSSSQYYYSPRDFIKLIQDCQREGRRIALLSELVRRLEENPRTLYFEKSLAITFDDAYVSLYTVLKELFLKNPIPITIFIPTAYVGRSNEWDQAKDLAHEQILGWQELASLKDMSIDIGSHSRHHFRLTDCDSEVQRSEIMGSLEDLKCFLPDLSTFLFSYPYGACDTEIQKLVKQSGYIGAVSNFAGNIRPYTNPYEIPRFTVLAEDDWKGISALSRSMWIKDLLRDIRDLLHRYNLRVA